MDENSTICDIFQVSLDVKDNKFYLKELHDELLQQAITMLSFKHAEIIIMEVLSSAAIKNPLLYLYGCYERSQNKKNIQDTKHLIIRYSILTLLNPFIFNACPLNISTVIFQPCIVSFVEQIMNNVNEEEIKDLLTIFIQEGIIPCFADLGESIDTIKISHLFDLLMLFTGKCKSILFSDWILPELSKIPYNVSQLETGNNLLAIILSRGPLNGSNSIISSNLPQALEYKNFVEKLHLFIKGLLVESTHRSILVSYFRKLLLANHNKSKIQFDTLSVSSYALLFNLASLWLQFSLPFASQGHIKVSVINTEFILQELLIDKISEPKELWNFPSFINASFLLALKCIHLGIIPLIQYLQLVSQTISETQETPLTTEILQKLKYSQKSAFFYLSNAEIFLEPIGIFIKFTIQWLSSLQLKSELSNQFVGILLEDLLEVLLWIAGTSAASIETHHVPWSLTLLNSFRPLLQEESLGELIVACLEGKYISNPHLVAKWVKFLFCTFETMNDDLGFLIYGAFKNQSSLLTSLIYFWTEIETKGGSTGGTSFYERFSIRYYLGGVLRKLWLSSTLQFRSLLVELEDKTLIVKFIHLMVNDMTFLLDESIERLGILAGKDENGDEKVEKECKIYLLFCKETLHLACDISRITCKPFLRNEIRDRIAGVLNYHLVQLVGPKSKKLRVHSEIKKRLEWKARDLLSPIISLYGCLGQHLSFVHALKADSRSFQMPLLNGITAMILNRQRDMVTPGDALLFVKVVESLQNYNTPSANIKEALKKVKGDLRLLDSDSLAAIEAFVAIEEDVPEEFLDPILATIMTDPVRMEVTSKKIIDRKTIIAHLMNDERDPFNRDPLSEKDLVPVDELRAKIHAWIAEKI